MKKLKLHELEKLQLNESGMRNAKGGGNGSDEETIYERPVDECFGYGSSSYASMTAGDMEVIPGWNPDPDPGAVHIAIPIE